MWRKSLNWIFHSIILSTPTHIVPKLSDGLNHPLGLQCGKSVSKGVQFKQEEEGEEEV